MNAFHSNWTGPFFARNSGEYFIEDFELLTTILSALKWQEFNGGIKMITDSVGYQYYKKLGIESIWNLGIDDSLDEVTSENIDPYTFWAAGKLFALRSQEGPCVMIDTDFIIWETLIDELMNHSLTVIHREAITKDVYPPKDTFKMKPSYAFNGALSWEVEPCNTAFIYINDEELKAFYTEEAIRFMKNTVGVDPLIYMVFAEQRMLSMCAAYKKVGIYNFSDIPMLFNRSQTQFTHIWGYKAYLRKYPNERVKFCRRCIKRILKDYPDKLDLLLQIESLKPYLQQEILLGSI